MQDSELYQKQDQELYQEWPFPSHFLEMNFTWVTYLAICSDFCCEVHIVHKALG